MNNEFDYYLIDSENYGDVPIMVNDDEYDSFGVGIFHDMKKYRRTSLHILHLIPKLIYLNRNLLTLCH